MTIYNVEIDDEGKTILVPKSEIAYTEELCSNGEKIADMLNEVFRADRQAEEHVWLIAMNIRCDVLGIFEVAHGGADYAHISNREIFIRLLLIGATSFILAHNHPSKSDTASACDIAMTERVERAAQLMNLHFLDHLIVFKGGFVSLREEGILEN